MAKKVKKNNYGIYIAIALVAVLSVAGVVGAYTGVAQQVIENVENLTINNGGGVGNIGAAQSEIASGFWDLYVENDLTVDGLFGVAAANGLGVGTVGDAGAITDGYIEKLAVVTISATNTASLVNPESETIWVYDSTVRIQTATSTAISYKLGTSSTAVIGKDDQCGFTATCATATAGDASISNTEASAGVGAATTALDVFFKADFEGINTLTGSGDRFVVPVLSGEYLIITASSTNSDSNYAGQVAQAQFKYFVIED